MSDPKREWDVPLGEQRQASLRLALSESRGNISQAARSLGISRSRAMFLLKDHDLVEFARGLRVEAGSKRRQDGQVLGPLPGPRNKKKP